MSLLRLWFLAFVGFSLTIGAWALATPYDAPPDEMSHILRAYQVLSGDLAPEPAAAVAGTGAFLSVPKNLTLISGCWRPHLDQPATCASEPGPPQPLVRVGDAAGRYNPLYYAIVGAPIKIWPTMKGVVMARLIGAAVGAALLAAALVSIVRYSRRRVMLGALLLGAAPMAIHMSGAINPSGFEIAAGIAFFASAIPLLLGNFGERPPTWLVCVTVVSGVILVTVRSGGPIWLALSALALLLPLRLRTVQLLLRPVALRWGIIVVAVASVASVLWILIMKSSQLGAQGAQPLDAGQILLGELDRWPWLIRMMIEANWPNLMWGPVWMLWEFPAAALMLVALIIGSRLDRVRLLIVVGGTIAIAAITEMVGYGTLGFVSQGRYVMPTLSGALLLAAWIIEQRGGISAARARLITRLAVVVTLPIQLHALQVAMVRFQRGIPQYPHLGDYNPLSGSWQPKVGSLLPFASAALGLLLLGVLCWRLAGGLSEPVPTADAAGQPEEGLDSAGSEHPFGRRDLPAAGAVS